MRAGITTMLFSKGNDKNGVTRFASMRGVFDSRASHSSVMSQEMIRTMDLMW